MDNGNWTRMEWHYLLHKGSVLDIRRCASRRDLKLLSSPTWFAHSRRWLQVFISFSDAYDFNWTMKKPTMAFAQIYLTQLRKFCDEEEHAVKAEKLKSNGKIYGEPNSYKMVSQSQIESCLERVQESVWQTYITHLVWVKDESSFDAHLARNPHWAV